MAWSCFKPSIEPDTDRKLAVRMDSHSSFGWRSWSLPRVDRTCCSWHFGLPSLGRDSDELAADGAGAHFTPLIIVISRYFPAAF